MTTLTPADPDYAERIQTGFNRQPAMEQFGIEIAELLPGCITLAMQFEEKLTQQHGFLHGGVVGTALDSATGFAALSLTAAGESVLTIEYKINFLAPARGERFEFVGRVSKPGRTISVCEGEGFALDQGRRKRVATITATLMTIRDRDDVRG